MEHGILLSGADNIDFMIHGVFKYSFFGHEVWITTTHVCVLIVMLLIIGFAIAANRQMAKAREVPEGFQNVVELIVEKLDAMVDAPMGKAAPKFYNYIGTIFIFILVSNISGLKACDHILFGTDGKENANGTEIGNGDQEFVFTGKQTLKKGTHCRAWR